ncbi:hypothetical protein OAB57_03555 [Bacteriovoracaceae bacterium]|nr:hypothetical protein [Bacteriovoracaceae bacterium]
MKIYGLKHFLVLGLIFNTLILFASSDKVDDIVVTTKVNKATVNIGESVIFTIKIKSKSNVSYTLLEMGDKIQGLRIIDTGKKLLPSDSPYPKVEEQWYELETDFSGSFVLPGAKIVYRAPDSNEEKIIETSETFLEVKSPETPTPQQPKLGPDGKSLPDTKKNVSKEGLRDIKSLAPVTKSYKWVPYTAAIFILILLGGVSFWYYRKRKNQADIIPQLLPHEKAFGLLDQLEQDFLTNGNIKEYHFQLSHILRLYLEDQFSLTATDMTFEEIKKSIFSTAKQHPQLTNDYITHCLRVLQETDRVKFTDFNPESDFSKELLLTTKTIVENTTPVSDIESSNEPEQYHAEESVI